MLIVQTLQSHNGRQRQHPLQTRAVLILKLYFYHTQERALQDIVETTVILQFNKCEVKCIVRIIGWCHENNGMNFKNNRQIL